MRIRRRAEFLALPTGTIYAKGKPWCFDGLSVKSDTWGNDWLTLSPMWVDDSDLEAMLESGASSPMQEIYERDGCFDEDEIFLVMERADLERLRAMVDAALAVTE